MPKKVFARATLIFPKSGSTWDPEKEVLSFPYRAFDLREFVKVCEKKQEIIGISIDQDDHVLSLLFQEKDK